MYIKRYRLFQIYNIFLGIVVLSVIITVNLDTDYFDLPNLSSLFVPKNSSKSNIYLTDVKIDDKYWNQLSNKDLWKIFQESVNHRNYERAFFILDSFKYRIKSPLKQKQYIIFDFIIKRFDTLLFKKILSDPYFYFFNIYEYYDNYDFLTYLFYDRDPKKNKYFLKLIINNKKFRQNPKDFFKSVIWADDTTAYYLLPDTMKFRFLKLYNISNVNYFKPKTVRLLALIKAIKEKKLDSVLNSFEGLQGVDPETYKFTLYTIYGLSGMIKNFENKVRQYYQYGDIELLKNCFFGVISNPEPNKFFINKAFGKNSFKPIYTYKILLKYLQKDDPYFIDNNLEKIAALCCYSFYDTLLLKKTYFVVNSKIDYFYNATPLIYTIKTYPYYRTTFSEDYKLSPRDKKIIYLLQNGANIYIKDDYGYTAIDYADKRKYYFAYYLLKKISEQQSN